MLDPNFDNIPSELRDREAWVCWHFGCRSCHTAFEPDVETCPECGTDTTKIPDNPATGRYAKSSDPDTWGDFEAAVDFHKRGDTKTEGIGFMFDENGPYVGVDLDACVQDGDLTGGAWDVVKRLNSYTEGSPSGTGLHIICRGFLPDLGNRSKDVKGMKELEMYDFGRYFTFTGRHLEGTPETVENRAQEVYDLCQDVFSAPDPEPDRTPTEPNDLDDRELIEKAKQADDAGKFARLWNGDTSEHDDDHSEADLALVGKLAFWTGGDRDRIDQLFRQSGLCREKWTGRPDYRKRTIDKAMKGRTEFYEPDRQSADGSPSGDGQARETPEIEDSGTWAAVRSVYDNSKAEGRLQAAEQAINDLHFATREETGRLYYYDEASKVYKSGGAQALQKLLVRKLKTRHSRHEQKEIESKIKALTYRTEFGGEFVPVANGDLFIGDSVTLKDADPDRAPFHRSPAKWDPNADCPQFAKHLHKVVPTKQERETLQEYVGYCLHHWDIPLHKALFMIGPTASGKSTTLTVIRKLLGKVSKLSPQQLVNGRFGPAELEGAWANIRSDISNAVLKDIGLFKEIVGGDPIYVERKFEQGYSLRPTAKHLYSANQLPEASIDDDAFYRRILLVSFPDTIPRDQRVNRAELDAELESELDGVLRWAVQGLQRVLEQDGFTHDLSPQETRRRWDEHSNSIGRFKASALNVTGDSDHVEAKQEVFSAYTDYCKEQGLSTETQRQLTRTLKRDSRITDADRTPPHHDTQTSCYVGVQIKTDWHPERDKVPF